MILLDSDDPSFKKSCGYIKGTDLFIIKSLFLHQNSYHDDKLSRDHLSVEEIPDLQWINSSVEKGERKE